MYIHAQTLHRLDIPFNTWINEHLQITYYIFYSQEHGIQQGCVGEFPHSWGNEYDTKIKISQTESDRKDLVLFFLHATQNISPR